MSVRHPLLVVGTADKHVILYNLANPQVGPIPHGAPWYALGVPQVPLVGPIPLVPPGMP